MGVSPSTDIEVESEEELETLAEIVAMEVEYREAVEAAEEEEVELGILEEDVEDLIESGDFWYTVIPEKEE